MHKVIPLAQTFSLPLFDKMKYTPEEIEALAEQAWQHIHESDLEGARTIGTDLMAAEVETGYRILALVTATEDQPQEAIRILEKGVAAHPDIWQLHLQLGNFYSDQGEYEQALATFAKAAQCPEVEMHWVQVNQAIVYYRQQEFESALNLLQQVEHAEAISEALMLQFQMLDELGRHELIIEIIEEDEVLDFLPQPQNEAEAEIHARICLLAAQAYWYEDAPAEVVDEFLGAAIYMDRTNPDVIWLWRERQPVFSEAARLFSIMISGRMAPAAVPEGKAAPLFMTTYEVVADTLDEGLDFIRAYEANLMDPNALIVNEAQESPAETGMAKGIYVVGALGFLMEE
jgi:tetratricopeptide (TPR) repeat protein